MSQAVLLQHEAYLLRQAFNQQFEAAQAAKRDLIASVEEKCTRIGQIERELGLHDSAPPVSVLVYAWELTSLLTSESGMLRHCRADVKHMWNGAVQGPYPCFWSLSLQCNAACGSACVSSCAPCITELCNYELVGLPSMLPKVAGDVAS